MAENGETAKSISICIPADSRVTDEDRSLINICETFKYHDFFSDWNQLTDSQQERLLQNLRVIDWGWIATYFYYRANVGSTEWHSLDPYCPPILTRRDEESNKKTSPLIVVEALKIGMVITSSGLVVGHVADLNETRFPIHFESLSTVCAEEIVKLFEKLEITSNDCYWVDGPSVGPQDDYLAFKSKSNILAALAVIPNLSIVSGFLQIIDGSSEYWKRVDVLLSKEGGTNFFEERKYLEARNAYYLLQSTGFPRALADMIWWCFQCNRKSDFMRVQGVRCLDTLRKLGVVYNKPTCLFSEKVCASVARVEEPLYGRLLFHKVARHASWIFEEMSGKSIKQKLVIMNDLLRGNELRKRVELDVWIRHPSEILPQELEKQKPIEYDGVRSAFQEILAQYE